MKNVFKTLLAGMMALTMIAAPAASFSNNDTSSETAVSVSAATKYYEFMVSDSNVRRTVYFHHINEPWIVYNKVFYTFDGDCLEIYDWDSARLIARWHGVRKC